MNEDSRWDEENRRGAYLYQQGRYAEAEHAFRTALRPDRLQACHARLRASRYACLVSRIKPRTAHIAHLSSQWHFGCLA